MHRRFGPSWMWEVNISSLSYITFIKVDPSLQARRYQLLRSMSFENGGCRINLPKPRAI